MKRYKVNYKVYSIPNEPIDMGQEFSFIYETDDSDYDFLIDDYLQQYFYVGNYGIESIQELEEILNKKKY